MGSNLWPCQQFFHPDCKNINKAPSVRVTVICGDHGHLWWDTDKGVVTTHQHCLSLYCTRLFLSLLSEAKGEFRNFVYLSG